MPALIFLDLPPEIRNLIYKQLFHDPFRDLHGCRYADFQTFRGVEKWVLHPGNPRRRLPINLLRTNRQIHAETLPYLYFRTHFGFDSLGGFISRLPTLCAHVPLYLKVHIKDTSILLKRDLDDHYMTPHQLECLKRLNIRVILLTRDSRILSEGPNQLVAQLVETGSVPAWICLSSAGERDSSPEQWIEGFIQSVIRGGRRASRRYPNLRGYEILFDDPWVERDRKPLGS